MTKDFIDWLKDLIPSQWCMYGNAFAIEQSVQGYQIAFEDWLEETYEREKGN